ncbi:MAG: hypothetical protein JNM07_03335 [Phycisphaerae bacterium]|nr:hypothetical protein [Phycisphaerae bacterium]
MKERPRQTGLDAAAAGHGVDRVIDQLRAIRRRARGVLVARRSALTGAAVVAALIVAVCGDYLLRTPGWLRGAFLLAGVGVLSWWMKRYVWPAVRFRPGLAELALRLEGSNAAGAEPLRGELASAVELGRGRGSGAEGLEPALLGRVSERLGRANPVGWIRIGGAVRAGAFLAIVVAIGGGAWLIQPRLASIGVLRVLAPWSGAVWPNRTLIVDLTVEDAYPRGAALALRAAVVRSDGPAEATRVEAEYRVVADGRADEWRRALLTNQGRIVEAPDRTREIVAGRERTQEESRGTLFERLLEGSELSARSSSEQEVRLEYVLRTSDDRTPARTIRLVERPKVSAAAAEVRPPAYAGERVTSAALGNGTDDRGVLGAARRGASAANGDDGRVLVGSRVRLDVTFNKLLPPPPDAPGPLRAFISRELGDDAAALAEEPGAEWSFTTSVVEDGPISGSAWRMEWVADRSVRLLVRPTDADAIRAADEAVFRIDVTEDRPPSVVITLPVTDEDVGPDAMVATAGEAKDDVGVETLAIRALAAHRPAGSAGAPATAEGSVPIVVAGAADRAATPGVGRESRASGTVAVAALAVRPGDEVWVQAVATDGFALAGRTHEAAVSATRRLRVVSAETILEQVRTELGAARRAAMRLDAEQAEAAQRLGRGEAAAVARQQSEIARQGASQRETLRGLTQRMERNRLEDATLDAMLAEGVSLMREAESAASRAGDRAAGAARAAETGDERGREIAARESAAAQAETRDALQRLASLLDAGKDSWATQRALERLASEQRELKRRTEEAGASTLGRDAATLSDAERARLADLAAQQRGLAERAARALADLAERERAMKSADAASASALAEAGARARRERVEERMADAAGQVERNQTGRAQAQQEEAAKSLEGMLDDIKNAARSRDETLRRELLSLIESLKGLVKQQEREIARLAASARGGDVRGLDAGVTAIARGTLAATERARSGSVPMREIASVLVLASAAQDRALAALRTEGPDTDVADAAERESLSHLRAALERAEKQAKEAEDRQQAAKRSELRRVYAAMLERQAGLRDRTRAAAGEEPGRRQRSAARDLGREQIALRDEAAALREKTAGLAEAGVFLLAHERLERAMTEAGERLDGGDPGAGTGRRQESAVSVLRGLVAALGENQRKRDEFRDGQDGSGGGEQSGGQQPEGLLPPASELRLLKELQLDALRLTRSADEEPDAAERGQLVREAAELQSMIAARAKELLEKLKQDEPGVRGVSPGPNEPGAHEEGAAE